MGYPFDSLTPSYATAMRHFGIVMIHAHEPDAAQFRFTSALAAQVLKSLSPVEGAMVSFHSVSDREN